MPTPRSPASDAESNVVEQLSTHGIGLRLLQKLLDDKPSNTRLVNFITGELLSLERKHHSSSTLFVPGTEIQLRHLTPPRAWIELAETTGLGMKMSFIAQIADTTLPACYPHVKKRLVKLDFGNGDTSTLQIPNTVRLFNDPMTKKRYGPDTMVLLRNVYRHEVGGHFILRYSEASYIRKLDKLSYAVLEATNARINGIEGEGCGEGLGRRLAARQSADVKPGH